jgi:hypothetical protein
MFFLLRVAFWLTIVLALLPSGGSSPSTQAEASQAKVGATDAVIAAGAAISDMSSFCERQPEACVAGAQAAATIGQRAQAGARMVYEFINDHSKGSETGSVIKAKLDTKSQPKLAAAIRTVPASAGSQSTLKDSDLAPVWQGPLTHAEMVPLPRKAPHRKV